jgi:uncharacterized protein (TIGR00369 family)
LTISPFEDQAVVSLMTEIFAERIPFNKWLGLKVESISPDCVKTSFEMRHELVGDYKRGMLHGGIVSSVLDTTGGLAVFTSIIEKREVKTSEEARKVFGRFSTIDLRVDFLRPGIGRRFVVTAHAVRTGKKLVVTRSELHNEQNALVALGTASFLVV